MASLPQSGIELVASGASAYIGDIDRAAKATDKFGDGLGSVAGKAGGFSTVLTGALMRVGEVAVDALGKAAQAAGQFLADSVTAAADVEQTLAVMGATSGATAAQLEQVRDTAIALGGDLSLPATSAQDASEAMLELTKAGFSVDEAMAAAKGTLQLAAAAQVDAGEAAAITAQAINAFGLEASDAAHIADLLAGGANASSASMTDLAQGLQQGGFAFEQGNQSVDTLVTSLAALTNVGLTGSDAGTALKNAMMRLMNPTEKAAGLMKDLGFSAYDANGNMKPLEDIIGELNIAMTGMTSEERDAALGTIFLSDGMKAMTPLLKMGRDGFIELRNEVSAAGSAQEVAGAQTQGFNGAIAGLQSQMETLQLIIGTKLLPLLTPLIQQVSAVASAFGEITMSALDAGIGSGEFLESLGLLDTALGLVPGTAEGVYTAIAQIATTIQSYIPPAIALAQSAFTDLSAFITSIMPTVQSIVTTTLAVMATFWQQHGATVMQVVNSVFPFIQGVIQTVLGVIQGVMAIALAAMTGDWETGFAQLAQANQTIWTGIQNVLFGVLNAIAAFFGTTVDGLIALWSSNLAKLATIATTSINEALAAFRTAIAPAAEIGSAIISGIVSGISSGASKLAKAATDAANGALKAAKEALGIKSPSKVFEVQVGYQMSAGIAEGIMDGAGLVNTALAGVTTAAIAKPGGGGSSSSVTNSRSLTYAPVYGSGVRPSPAMDVSLARSLAL